MQLLCHLPSRGFIEDGRTFWPKAPSGPSRVPAGGQSDLIRARFTTSRKASDLYENMALHILNPEAVPKNGTSLTPVSTGSAASNQQGFRITITRGQAVGNGTMSKSNLGLSDLLQLMTLSSRSTRRYARGQLGSARRLPVAQIGPELVLSRIAGVPAFQALPLRVARDHSRDDVVSR